MPATQLPATGLYQPVSRTSASAPGAEDTPNIHRLVGTDTNSSSRTDSTESSFVLSSRLNSVEIKPILGTKTNFDVSNVSGEDFNIDPVMRNKILALPAGGSFFNSIYEGNIKRVAAEVFISSVHANRSLPLGKR